MKFIIQVILIGLLSYFTQQIFAWWLCGVSAFFIATIIPSRSFNAFLAGFIGVGVLWLLIVTKINIETNSILTDKVSAIFKLGDDAIIIIASTLIGALTGGFSALSGNLFRKLFEDDHKNGYYS